MNTPYGPESRLRRRWPTHYRWLDVLPGLMAVLVLLPACTALQGVTRAGAIWLVLALACNSRRVLVALFWPVVLLLPAALYYIHISGVPPGYPLWLILFYCSAPVVLGYVRPVLPYLCIWVGVWSILVGLYLSRPRGPVVRMRPVARLVGMAVLTAWIVVPTVRLWQHLPPTRGGTENPMVAIHSRFDRAWPWSMLTGYVAARRETRRLTDMARRISHEPVHFLAPPQPDMPQVIVLAIGESARRDHHHMYGYGVPTTPEMEQVPDLLHFDDMVTPFDYTVGAVPVILSGYDRLRSGSVSGHDLVSVFNAAGYDTWWISNHPRLGPYDSVIGAYSEQAHHIAYTTVHGGLMSSPVLDERMLPVVDGAIRGAKGPVFIVLHLFGSHENAADRYPAAFGGIGTPYDNSIAYTDHMLAHVVASLQAHGGPAALFYVSDHGVRVGECTAGIPTHGDVRAAYEIPFYLWASAAWQAAHPQAMQAARDNVHAPLTLAALPPSVLDAAGLGYEGAEMDMSVLSPHPARPRRIVHGDSGANRDVDYDHSHDDASCHIARD
ncbi:phosphoethanolamine transferase [Komagataeibacter melaceti]|uniref:Phosphoethanolamine transferase n=1 Tax=Komagataeibacter melaceti TaxID=2766577 RepID=A0A371Z2X1_9PROT|nr:phosphoethanolamine transferase [Komagataeibacter melaceti]RFD20825.1 phosphoethanolamine transferase [Komagataeibacter melaceti]